MDTSHARPPTPGPVPFRLDIIRAKDIHLRTMSVSLKRKTFMILALALSLAISLIVIATDEGLQERLGTTYWVVALSLIGCILLVLAGYVWDRTLVQRIREMNEHASSGSSDSSVSQSDSATDDPDEIIGLARKIEQMAKTLQKVEASYRGIVEDQPDLICRYKQDGRLTFANGAYSNFFGRKRQELVGQPWAIVALNKTPWPIVGQPPDTLTFECEITSAEGRRAVFLWTHRAIKDRDGNLLEYQAVGHDITDRKELEAVLRAAKEAAESADRAKSEFLAIVSHEIRTPINGIVGFARLLKESPLTQEQISFVDTIQRCGLSLETLVTDILDLSKIEAGRLEIMHSPFSLQDCVNDVVQLFSEPARQAGISLGVRYDENVPALLTGDQNRLRQVLSNLVNNAIKFTEKGGIDIHVSCDRGSPNGDGGEQQLRLFCAVSDTGIGIAPSDLDRLFRPFSQLDTSTTRRHGGTGLGLVISKRLCELMGGTISVSSEPKKGSTFRFNVTMEYQPGDSIPPFPARSPAPAAA